MSLHVVHHATLSLYTYIYACRYADYRHAHKPIVVESSSIGGQETLELGVAYRMLPVPAGTSSGLEELCSALRVSPLRD